MKAKYYITKAGPEEKDFNLRYGKDNDSKHVAYLIKTEKEEAEKIADVLNEVEKLRTILNSIRKDCRRGAHKLGMSAAGVTDIAIRCDRVLFYYIPGHDTEI